MNYVYMSLDELLINLAISCRYTGSMLDIDA